ncbi:MAG TPA: ABC transporter ATP-binding protein, partial [Candidatus Acidoferrales bacterium]|nr:ABC transporter ATP-binding protein [Candidatus Acidoferrales bacterium]
MHIQLDKLSKRFGRRHALREMSTTFEPGQIVAVLGPNGAGKTTLLRCLAGVMVPSSGEILLDGTPLRRGQQEQRRRIFFIPDIPMFFPRMTVIQHIAMVLRLYQVAPGHIEDRVVACLDQLDILTSAESPILVLSRGQAYKTALAALLSVGPELWILDEPFTSGMDPVGMAVFKQYARQAAEKGAIIIYSTQILEIAEGFSDRVCLFDRGLLRLDESVRALRERVGVSSGALEEAFRRLQAERQ